MFKKVITLFIVMTYAFIANQITFAQISGQPRSVGTGLWWFFSLGVLVLGAWVLIRNASRWHKRRKV